MLIDGLVGVPLSKPGQPESGDLVARYLRGEHEEVWNLLRQSPVISGALREEALEVAQETMRRLLRNAELLIGRLADRGWVPLGGSFRTPPSDEDARAIDELEADTGAPLPPSLKAFWNVVGGIDLVWDYHRGARVPDFGLALAIDELDPLSIDPARFALGALEDWRADQPNIDPGLPIQLRLDLAPDALHKANTSGGPPYAVGLPFLGADPPFENEEHQLTFVEYLRLALRFAGFPGLELQMERADVQEFVRELTAGFVPF